MFSAYQVPSAGATAGLMDPTNDPRRSLLAQSNLQQTMPMSRFTSPTFMPTVSPLDVSPLATQTLFTSPLDQVMGQLQARSGMIGLGNPLLGSGLQTGLTSGISTIAGFNPLMAGSGFGRMGATGFGINPLLASQYGAGITGLTSGMLGSPLAAQSAFGLGSSWNPALQWGASSWNPLTTGVNPLTAAACHPASMSAAACNPLSMPAAAFNPLSMSACHPLSMSAAACHPMSGLNTWAIGGTGLNPTGLTGLETGITGIPGAIGATPQSHWILQGLKHDRLYELKIHNYIEGAIDLLRGIRPTDQVWNALIAGIPVNPQQVAQAIQMDRQVDVRIADLVEFLLKVSRRFNEANCITEDLISGKTYTGPAPNILEVGANQQKANLIKNELVNLFAMSGRV